jgi:hypothetical protein
MTGGVHRPAKQGQGVATAWCERLARLVQERVRHAGTRGATCVSACRARARCWAGCGSLG